MFEFSVKLPAGGVIRHVPAPFSFGKQLVPKDIESFAPLTNVAVSGIIVKLPAS